MSQNNLPLQKITEMLKEVYSKARHSSAEIREQVVEEVLAKYEIERRLMVYTVWELQKFPVGSRFYHSLLGHGEIVTRKGVRMPFMKFDNGQFHALVADGIPWNLPMLHLGE